MHWYFIYQSDITRDDGEHHFSAYAASIPSWSCGPLHLFYYMTTSVHSGSRHDFQKCKTEVALLHTSCHMTHEFWLSRAKLPVSVELDMLSWSTTSNELVPFTWNQSSSPKSSLAVRFAQARPARWSVLNSCIFSYIVMSHTQASSKLPPPPHTA